MSWTDLPEEEKLLYVAGALPAGRRARIFIRSRLDGALRLELRRLREEERAFAKGIGPRLAERLDARRGLAPDPGSRAPRRREIPHRHAPFVWERMSPITAFAGVTLCALMAGILLAARFADPEKIGGGRPYLAMAEGHPPRPVLILGY